MSLKAVGVVAGEDKLNNAHKSGEPYTVDTEQLKELIAGGFSATNEKIAELKKTTEELVKYQREANGRTGKNESAIVRLDERIGEIKDDMKDTARELREHFELKISTQKDEINDLKEQASKVRNWLIGVGVAALLLGSGAGAFMNNLFANKP